MPAEWTRQQAVWLSWPVDDPRHWGGAKRDLMWAKFAEIAAAISRHEPVRINAPAADHAANVSANLTCSKGISNGRGPTGGTRTMTTKPITLPTIRVASSATPASTAAGAHDTRPASAAASAAARCHVRHASRESHELRDIAARSDTSTIVKRSGLARPRTVNTPASIGPVTR